MITCTVFIILLLCTACVDKEGYPYTYDPPPSPSTQEDYEYYDPYTPNSWIDRERERNRKRIGKFIIPKTQEEDTSLKLIDTLWTKVNIHTEAYRTAINNFYKLYDIKTKTEEYNSELIGTAMRSITTLEQAISQLRNAGGRSSHFSRLEGVLHADKNFLLLVKYAVLENMVQYYRAGETFYLNQNQETAKEALEVHAKLRESIDQFEKHGGDKSFFDLEALEQELSEDQILMESFVYRLA